MPYLRHYWEVWAHMCVIYSHIETLCFNVWIPLFRKERHIKNTCILWSHKSKLSLWTIIVFFLIFSVYFVCNVLFYFHGHRKLFFLSIWNISVAFSMFIPCSILEKLQLQSFLFSEQMTISYLFLYLLLARKWCFHPCALKSWKCWRHDS